MLRRLMNGLRRLSRDLLLPFCFYAGVVAIKLWVDASHPGLWLIVGATMLIAGAELLAECSPAVAAFLFTSRLQTVAAVVLATIVAGVALAAFDYTALPSRLDIARAIVVGCGVGGGIRHAYLASFRRRRQNRSTWVVRLMLLFVVGGIVLLLPNDQAPIASAAYVFSIGVGFLWHFLWRRWDELTTRCQRVGRIVSKQLEAHGASGEPAAILAAKAFGERNFEEALRLVADAHGSGMALIKAAVQRLRRQNGEAVVTIDKELERPNRDAAPEDVLLHILKAICLMDLGNYREADSALRASGLTQCFLSLFLQALVRIEKLPYPGTPSWEAAAPARREAMYLLERAMVLHITNAPKPPLASVVASLVPVTRTFIDDVQAYALLKAGNMSMSKKVLESCIEEDTTFAPSYLHLGEWHLANAALADLKNEADRIERSSRAAEFCFLVAIALENEPSHTKRRAQELAKPRSGGRLTPASV